MSRDPYTKGPISDGGMDPRDRDRKPERRVIGTSTAVGLTRDGFLCRVVTATCDDGTIWMLSDRDDGGWGWNRLPPIPGAAL